MRLTRSQKNLKEVNVKSENLYYLTAVEMLHRIRGKSLGSRYRENRGCRVQDKRFYPYNFRVHPKSSEKV